MTITRTPFRISFLGGGTDYPIWYEKNGGATLSTTINKYCYITTRYLPPFFDCKYRVRYRDLEEVNEISEIKHPSVRESLRFLNFKHGIETQHNSDVPGMSGLGSSSAFTVGLLHSLHALRGEVATKKQLALGAIHVEQNLIGENVGSQDQTSTAFGGLNKIEFGGEEKIRVIPVSLDSRRFQEFQDHLMLFFTGFPRNASEVAAEQIKLTPQKNQELSRMRALVDEGVKILTNGQTNIEEFGKLLHESWLLKRGLSSKITNQHIDKIYKQAQLSGALGGKLLGAGGGGFMLFFVRPQDQPRVKSALSNILQVPFKFENAGSQVIYQMPQEEDHDELLSKYRNEYI